MTAPPSRHTPERLFSRPDWSRAQAASSALRSETIGGLLLLAGTAVALVWANSPWRSAYASLIGATVGPSGLHLDLTVAQWAADGLLAVFFFVVGLELKREFVDGDLRSPRRAALPVAAAVGGMIGPIGVYLVVNAVMEGGTTQGWAVPMATDIAFAVAVLAIISTHLPSGLRSFLLTLAVVDDLLSVLVIAVLFTDTIHPAPLLAALAVITLFGFLTHRRIAAWWVLLPLALAGWALMHASGVHATIAGVLLGFAVPAVTRGGEQHSLSERFEHRWRPISAAIAVPIFAITAAGVSLTARGLSDAMTDPAAVGVALGLVVGKLIGVFGAAYLLARFTHAALDEDLSWWDVLGLALLAGIGFTVSLLLGELAFDADDPQHSHVKTAILLGSVAAAVLAALILRWRNRIYRQLCAQEDIDEDMDGIPDVYQHRPSPSGL